MKEDFFMQGTEMDSGHLFNATTVGSLTLKSVFLLDLAIVIHAYLVISDG